MIRFINTLFSLFILLSAFGCNLPDKAPSRPLNYRATTVYPAWYQPETIDTLRLVSWNIEHFVDGYDNPYTQNSREDNPPTNMAERRKLLAKALRKLDADVVVFQELESDSYLRKFADEYLADMGYRLFAALESPDWYMNVVMMSRVPLGMFYSYAHINTPIPGETDENGNPASQTFINNRMWTADLLINDAYTLTVTGVHLKAGRGKRNIAWRTGQIDLLRNHLATLMDGYPARNMIVMGDVNATPDSDEFKRLLGNTPPVFVDPLERTNIFSHPSDSVFWRIDHILPNRQAFNELIDKKTEVVRPLSPQEMTLISDHLPLKARIIPRDR